MNQQSDLRIWGALGALLIVAFVVYTAPFLIRPAASPGSPIGQPNFPGQPTNPGLPNNPGQPVNPGQPAVAGPPTWVQPGTRITWYNAAASVAGSRFAWVEDPNGSWTDPATGKKYSRTDEPGPNGEAPPGQPSASGDGLTQFNVIALDGANVVLESQGFSFLHIQPPLMTPRYDGAASVAGTYVDGAWIHPTELARLAQTNLSPIATLRGRYTIGNTTYDAISFVNGLGAGSGGNYVSYTYDIATGVLLSANTSTAGIRSPFAAPGEGAPVGNTQLTVARYISTRNVNLPGLGAPLPDWATTVSRLSYTGTYGIVNPVDPTAGAMTVPAEHVAEFGQSGPTWRAFQARTLAPQAGLDGRSQGIAGSVGGYWWSPQALAGMSQGQVLDQDPATGERTSVAYAGAGPNGQPVVSVLAEAQGYAFRRTYEVQSGTLVGYEVFTAADGSTLSVQLVDRQ